MSELTHDVPFKTVADVPLDDQRVLLRADFNAPMHDGAIVDDDRISATLPTLRHLLDRDASVVITAHAGRPTNGYDRSLSLRLVSDRLAELLDREVQFLPECVGGSTRRQTRTMGAGAVALAENLRFHSAETTKNVNRAERFAHALARDSSADYFVQDAFGSVHNSHASIVGVSRFLPAVSGLLVASEYAQITQAIQAPVRPLTIISGGSKVSDKVPLIERYIDIADHIILGGGPANTLLAYRGHEVGQSLAERDINPILKLIYERARQKVGEDKIDDLIVLPQDLAYEDVDGNRRECDVSDFPRDAIAYDIGRKSVEQAIALMGNQGTVIFNGPVGLFEKPGFAQSSVELARHIADSNLDSIVGGGDTGAMIRSVPGLANGITHMSRGGQACLRLISGGNMPGIDALMQKGGTHGNN